MSEANSPSGAPPEAPISPWLSNTAKVSLCLSVRRGRDGEPVLFEIGSDGRVARVKVGPNYTMPVR